MRDETYVQERYICLDCSFSGIHKLKLEETRYLPNPCELSSRNTDGQTSHAKERTKRTYLGATPSKIDLLSVTNNCQRYAATLGETESNTLLKRHHQQDVSTLAVVCDKAIQGQVAIARNWLRGQNNILARCCLLHGLDRLSANGYG